MLDDLKTFLVCSKITVTVVLDGSRPTKCFLELSRATKPSHANSVVLRSGRRRVLGYTQAVRVFTAGVVSGVDWQQPLLVMPRLCHAPAFDSNLDPFIAIDRLRLGTGRNEWVEVGA